MLESNDTLSWLSDMSGLADGVARAVRRLGKPPPWSKNKALKLKGYKWMADALECYVEELWRSNGESEIRKTFDRTWSYLLDLIVKYNLAYWQMIL
jgi:hypothetical protein